MKVWLIGACVMVFVLASSVPSQAVSEPTWTYFWWNGGEPPTPMIYGWDGYCFLLNGSLGNSATDSIGMFIEYNTWHLGGTTTAGGNTWAYAGCVSWPGDWETSASGWTGASGQSLSSNDCFCTIQGLSYSGVTDRNTPDFQVYGYPATNMSVTLGVNIQNPDDSVSPAESLEAGCICQSGQSPYWGTDCLAPPPNSGPNLKIINSTGNFTPVEIYDGDDWTIESSVPQVCGLLSVQTYITGGPFTFDMGLITDGGHNWQLSQSGADSVTVGCIAYP